MDDAQLQGGYGRPAGGAGWRARLRLPHLSWDELFAVPPAGEQALPRVGTRAVLLECAIIAVVVLAFCGGFLDLGSRRPLPGNEAEIVQTLDWTLVQSLAQRHFPLWNPALQTGMPFVADPFLHIYNPLASLPVLLLGVSDGFKVALFLSFLFAALGMWRMGLALGLGRAARLWMAFMYAFTGAAVARFFQGEYDFVLGFAWIPWAIAGLLIAVRTRSRSDVALAAVSLALLFFSGNTYYSYYMLFVLVLFALVMLFDLRRERPHVVFHVRAAAVFALVGALSLGLVAVQLLPLFGFWSHIVKESDPQFHGAQSLWQILLDYLSIDTQRADAIKALPREEFYAYTGIWPFIGLLLLPVAFIRRQRKPLVFLTLLLVFAWLWIDIRHMPWQSIYASSSILNQFRYPTRMLIYGALALIALGAVGLDLLWQALPARLPLAEVSVPAVGRWTFARLGMVVLMLFMVWSVLDVYNINGQHARSADPYQTAYDIAGWLRRSQPGEYYVGTPLGWHGALAGNSLRYIDGWYGFGITGLLEGARNSRYVQARPNYVILGKDQQPNQPDAEVVQPFSEHVVYRYPHSLPMAFAVDKEQLATPGSRELWRDDVQELKLQTSGPNDIRVVAEGQPGSTMVVLVSALPGWRLTVDGQPATLQNVGGYLAAELQPGLHRYGFAYTAPLFTAGLIISLLALLATLVLAWPSLRHTWLSALAWTRTLRFPSFPETIPSDVVPQHRPHPATAALVAWLVPDWLARRKTGAPTPVAPGTGPSDAIELERSRAPSDATGPAAGVPYVVSAEPSGASEGFAAVWPVELDALYQDGMFKPLQPLALPNATMVRLTIQPVTASVDGGGVPAVRDVIVREAPGRVGPMSWSGRAYDVGPLLRRLSGALSLEWVLFGLSLLVYAVTRLWALDRFPIYFFADEATHAVIAQDLLNNGFRDAHGSFLPLYFEAAGMRWTPLLSVYVHTISVFLFGKSIIVTRATSGIVSILGAAAVALILKLIFRARFWWVGALLMAIAPAWFLHTRTGFETVMMSSFFACFLLFYLLYRTRSPNYLFLALLFGAATFYTYSNGQMIMAAAGAFLIVSDLRYHLRQWRTTLWGAVLLLVLMLPLLFFRLGEPGALPQHLRAIDSYWFRAVPLQDKLIQFVKTYTYGLSPAYWFIPNDHDLARHRMAGYGNLSIVTLPLLLIGVALCLWRVRSATHRAVLLAALATPVGAALVEVSITRVLAFIGPACVLMGLGLDWLLSHLGRRISYRALAGATFAILSLASIGMLRDALRNGPLWYSDYGLYGMQYGAKQLFAEALPAYLERNPDTQIMMSSTWANGSDMFIRFFLPPEQRSRVQMLNIDYYMDHKADLNPNVLLVMTPPEYQQAAASPKFKSIDVEQIIPYPDGTPGFYFPRLAYADGVDAIFAAEREARRQLVEDQIVLGGQSVTARYSQLEAGQIKDLFDGDPFTLVRGREANPLIVDLTFSQPHPLAGLTGTFGTMDFALTAKLYADAASDPVVYEQTYQNLPPDPTVQLTFDKGPQTVSRLRLEVKQLNTGENAKIHVRELALR